MFTLVHLIYVAANVPDNLFGRNWTNQQADLVSELPAFLLCEIGLVALVACCYCLERAVSVLPKAWECQDMACC